MPKVTAPKRLQAPTFTPARVGDWVETDPAIRAYMRIYGYADEAITAHLNRVMTEQEERSARARRERVDSAESVRSTEAALTATKQPAVKQPKKVIEPAVTCSLDDF